MSLGLPNKKEYQYTDFIGLAPNNDDRFNTLIKVSNILTSNYNLDEILQQSVDLVVDEFGYSAGVIFVNQTNEGKIYSKTYTDKQIYHAMIKIIGRSFPSLSVDYTVKDNAVVKSILQNRIVESNVLSDFIYPVVPLHICNLIQNATKIKNITVLPIMYGQYALGAFMVTKNTAESFDLDYKFLVMFSKQIAMAMNNALMFQQTYAGKFEQEKLQEQQIKEKAESISNPFDNSTK